MKVERVDVSSLNQDPSNARKHDERNIESIKASLAKFGQQHPIIVDTNNIVIAGNGRLKAMHSLGWSECDIVRTDLKGVEAAAFAIADNRTAELAEWDDEALALTLAALQNDETIDEMVAGFNASEIEALINDAVGMGTDGKTDDDAVPEVEDETISERGKVYQLGNHRLMCGDSESADDVYKLMNGEKADMVFTDPPYGIAYAGKTEEALTIKSDDCDEETLAGYVKSWFDNVDRVARDGAYLIATVPAGPLHPIFALDWKDRGWLRQMMVWNKSSLVMGGSEYHYKHEPILFVWKKRRKAKKYRSDQDNSLGFPKTKRKQVASNYETCRNVGVWYRATHTARRSDVRAIRWKWHLLDCLRKDWKDMLRNGAGRKIL